MKNENLFPGKVREESLDPENWDELKQLGQRMVGNMIDFLQNIGEQPVWRQPPASVKESFKKALPESPQEFSSVYEEFQENIFPYYLGNIHPRYWSWVMGTGSAQGMLADMLSSAMNCNVGIGDQAAVYVDAQVIDWCKEMMNFPAESSGVLVNGASVANLNALIVARNSFDSGIRKYGLAAGKKLKLYASSETHSCIQKAAEIIGIGSDGVRIVKVNENYEMDTDHLEKLILEDKADGHLPFCVVANVGTVNTGAIDPLDKIFLTTLKHNLWFHVDGAFGALLKLLPAFQEKLRCIEFADSVAFDLHKWMYMPYEAGVVIVKNANKHRLAFALEPDYISNQGRGIAGGPEPTSNFGFDLSRNFKALKVWMLIKENGIDKFRRLINQNLEQAEFLAVKIMSSHQLQLMAHVSSNIVCFRFHRSGLSKGELNAINKEILMQLHERAIAAPSYTKLNSNFCLRVAIVNHRSKKEDFETLVNAVLELGNEISSEYLLKQQVSRGVTEEVVY